MLEKISAPISVNLVFDHKKRWVYPKELVWEGEKHPITRVGLHHTFRKGSTLYHVFSVASGETFFRIVLSTQSLHWTLEEVSDGLPG